VAYWEAFRSLTDSLFERSGCARLQIANDAGDWQRYLARILEFLELPPAIGEAALRLSEAAARRLAGTYGFTHRGSARSCEITFTDGFLYVTGMPEVWPRTRLIPREGEPGVFLTESLPFEIRFLTDEDGEARELRAGGRDLLGGSIPRTYTRRGRALPRR
jgi:hypothetical protein